MTGQGMIDHDEDSCKRNKNVIFFIVVTKARQKIKNLNYLQQNGQFFNHLDHDQPELMRCVMSNAESKLIDDF